MMDLAAVGAMSIDMHMAQTMNQVALSTTKKAMDMAEVEGNALIEMMNQANPVSFGHTLDTYA